MKYFKTIVICAGIVVAALFAANIICFVQLYSSIKKRYVEDVEQSLRRVDQIEIVDRIVDAGLGEDDDVVWIQFGLQKSELGDEYSQGYRRVDRQILSEITGYLHNNYGNRLGPPDIANMEEAFRRDLNYSGYYPKEVYIAGPDNTPECGADLWHIEYNVDGEHIYDAYISPLTANILREMSGVIVTSALIALVLISGFWYLLHVIGRLRTIEEMKDDFTNNMTHELKTPIAIAYAANDSLLQFPDPQDEERTRKYLTVALDQLAKLAGLVENILAMSMERRKSLAMAKESLHIRPLLESVIEQQKLKADKQCEITLDCGASTIVEADPTHFTNVVGNLIDNAIKYSGDTVTIRIKADGDAISVSDNGIGIPEKSLPEIFNKFYRVPHGNRSEVRGYGIGLFYVKSIVEKHGWHIYVESRYGKGSTFTIYFNRQ